MSGKLRSFAATRFDFVVFFGAFMLRSCCMEPPGGNDNR
jgi:hypothetical protein